MPVETSFDEQYPAQAQGPTVQAAVPAAVHGLATTVTASGNTVSNLINSDGFQSISVGVTSTQAGQVSIRRYLDDAGTIAQGSALTASLAANTAVVLNTTDGLPFASFKVTITNTGGSTATLSGLIILLQSLSAPGASAGGGGGGDASAANQSTQITEETAIANAAGSTGDSAYAGSGSSSIVSVLKGVYAAIVGTLVANITKIGGAALALGQTTMAASIPVAIASNQSTISTNIAQIGGTNAVNGSLGQTTMASSVPVVIASNQSAVAAGGDIASGSSDSGNPVKIGGVAMTANPTAVTNGQRANAAFDKVGRQIVVGSIRALKGVQHTTITSSTAETTIVTAISAIFADLYGLILTNTSATATSATLKDSTAGTIRAVFEIPAGDSRGFMLPESAAIPQATVNNNWTLTCGASVNSLEVTALYVQNI